MCGRLRFAVSRHLMKNILVFLRCSLFFAINSLSSPEYSVFFSGSIGQYLSDDVKVFIKGYSLILTDSPVNRCS